jgi:CBS domain-containing protein
MLFPIQQLIEGRGAPLCVRKDTTVNDALALMVKNDYSQLPVVDEDGDLCGIISETSIIGMYHHVGATVSLLDLTVDHCATTPVTISPESDIFVALDLLKNVYAIVVVKNKKPVGILTDYDTTHFFRDVTEDLILVEDIEVTLRQQYIEIAFPEEKALEAALIKAFGHDKKDTTKPAQEYEELSFRQHAQLITTGKNWPKFKGTLEPKDLFKQLMEQVGEIRNQLAHFRGRLDPVQHNVLLRARDWLAARPKLALPVADEQQVVRIYADDVPTEKPAEKYAPLENSGQL